MNATLLLVLSALALDVSPGPAPMTEPAPAPNLTRVDVRGRAGAVVPGPLAFGDYHLARLNRTWRLSAEDRRRFHLPAGTREGFVFRLYDGADATAVRCGTTQVNRRARLGCWAGSGGDALRIEAVTWTRSLFGDRLRGTVTAGGETLAFREAKGLADRPDATYVLARGSAIVGAVSMRGTGAVWTDPATDAATQRAVAALAAVLFLHADLGAS